MKKLNLNTRIPGVELIDYGYGSIHIYVYNPEDRTARLTKTGSVICEVIAKLRFDNPDMVKVETLTEVRTLEPECAEFVLILKE